MVLDLQATRYTSSADDFCFYVFKNFGQRANPGARKASALGAAQTTELWRVTTGMKERW